jgi:hypothetical protein
MGTGIFNPENPLLLLAIFCGVSYLRTVGIIFNLSLLFIIEAPICLSA